ncbi:LAFE_0H09934g1_1 [Lachancea fermentati]|uniref:LAFE_0H09934g1_1 n=1 Tax=Lachancea fermentati TaxID=4955 RepID=A0A1G4MKD0_LACFM|nr:LAFE_0H09934g1_1 [Lachancea fermentati]
MSAFAAKDFKASEYSKARPTYPEEFYQILKDYHTGNYDLLVDVGCGPGTATFQMAKYMPFKRIIGTDVSSTMINRAKERLTNIPFEGISFEIRSAEDLSMAEEGTVDMITVAQCCHWLEFPRFQDAAAKALRHNGTLAIWGYVDPVFLDHPELDAMLEDFQFSKSKLGPYWQQPGKTIIRRLFQDLPLSESSFGNIRDVRFTAEDARRGIKEPQKPLKIVRTMTIRDFSDYIETWSSYHWWKHDNPGKPDIRNAFFLNLFASTHLTWNSSVRVTWNTVYKLGRRLAR